MFKQTDLLPLNQNNYELWLSKSMEFGQWLSDLPSDTPMEIHLSVGPFDTTPRDWSYRLFTQEEQATMAPCHRVILGCMDLWCERVEEVEFATVFAPETHESDPDFTWHNGIVHAMYAVPDLVAAVQSTYLGRVYRAHGFDPDQFLADTTDVLGSNAVMDYLEAMLYVCEMEDEIAAMNGDPDKEMVASLMRTICGDVRSHLELLWTNAKNQKEVK